MSDEAIRRRVVAEPSRSYAVSAGAGSGKTSLLVDRVVGLFETEAAPHEIAVITFTEAAASEARRRIFDRVGARLDGRAEPSNLLCPLDADRRAGLERAAADFGRLTVSTLHAFALSLLEAEALEGSWVPGSAIEDAALGRDVVPGERARWWRHELYRAEPGLAIESRLHATGVNIDDAARRLLGSRDLAPHVDPGPALDAEALRAAIAHARELGEACLATADCKLYGPCVAFLDACAAVLDEARAEDLGASLHRLARPRTSGVGRAPHWGGNDAKQAFAEAIEAINEVVAAHPCRLHAELTRALSTELLPRVVAAKRREGVVSYDDLLFFAAELLRDRPLARARLRRRYPRLLVDEVQDTDPLQAEIVSLLARAEEGAEAPWTERPFGQGRIFAVGDPKQSIYRFRRADVRTWHEIERTIGLDGQRAALARNFRSVPGIVSFVNHAFREMPGFEPLEATRGPAELDPVVAIRSELDDDPDAIARHLMDLERQGARVVDAGTGELRAFEWRDVMILVPAWGRADALLDRLTCAGIPAFVDGGRAFFLRDEVRLALAGLRALVDPGDAEAVVFCLRGLFGHSHEDLARHRAAGEGWLYTLPGERVTPCTPSLETLARVRATKLGGGLDARLDVLLEESEAPLVWGLTERATAIAANLDKVRELVRRIEAEGAAPAEVVERLEHLARTEPEEDLPLRPFEADAVEITSLFKAKGREAPIVCLAGMERVTDRVLAAVDRESGKIATSIGALSPADWELRKAAEHEAAGEERARWMYVASTRARDQLVFCTHEDRGSRKSAVAEPHLGRAIGTIDPEEHGALRSVGPEAKARLLIREQLAEAPDREEVFGPWTAAVDAALATRGSGGDPAAAFGARRAAELRRARERGVRWRSVRDVARSRLEARYGRLSFAGTGIGAQAGKAVHRVMEAVDLGRPRASVEAEALALLPVYATLERLSAEEQSNAEAVLIALLGHELLDEIRAAPERWHEVPFAHPELRPDGSADPRRVVNGVIDLCFPVDPARRRWVVVDWKTDRPPPGSHGEAQYREQVALYAEALIRTRVHRAPEEVRTVLVGPVEPEPEPDLAELLELAEPAHREALEASLAAGVPPPRVKDEALEGPCEGDVIELHWPDVKLALVYAENDALAEELESRGYEVHRAPEDGPAEAGFWARVELLAQPD